MTQSDGELSKWENMFPVGFEPHSLGDVDALARSSDEEDSLRHTPFENNTTACQVKHWQQQERSTSAD